MACVSLVPNANPRLPILTKHRIDTIKYKAGSWARRHEGDKYNFNPFARLSSRLNPVDEEQGLQRSRSEGIFQSHQESARNWNNQVERQDFGGVQHADTAPPASAASPKSPPDNWPTHQPVESEPHSDAKVSDAQTSDADGIPVAPSSTADAEKGPKRRKFGILSKGKDSDSPERSLTGGSQKTKSTKKITVMSQIRATVFGSWINLLLVVVPVGFAVNYVRVDGNHINGTAIFVVNFIAIIPLAGMLSYATEELALRVGETVGGLLNATFG